MQTLSDFIASFGSQRIQKTLDVTRQAVDQWASLSSAPTPERAFELIIISNGVLSWEAIYQPYVNKKLKGKKKTYKSSASGVNLKLSMDL